MAYYAEEEEVWKCTKHPPKRRRCSGICPQCLKERLSLLCPDCATPHPCSCATSSSSPSTSSSSSFSLHFSDPRISTLIDNEPPFRRSRSSAFPFFRSARYAAPPPEVVPEEGGKRSLWSVIWGHKGKREKLGSGVVGEMKRSRSVVVDGPTKAKGWYFPSPMKVFRHSSKSSKVVQERSPLHRG